MTTRARLALAVFVATEIAGAAIYIVNGRKMWFFGVFGDEWDFLAGRRLTIHDLLVRHGDHLVALPALAFRVMYAVVGLRSYLPYQLLAIGLHLAAAALLRVIMRRAGVGPWIATAAAGTFVLFGSGSQDILVAFQITFTGALVFGLIQLLLADHAGPIDRNDWLGLLAGLAALLCSDVAIVMIAVVGLACLLRRRWAAAALQTVPLAAIYLAWMAGFGRHAQTSLGFSPVSSSVRSSLSATFAALGQVPFAGWALAVMLIVGFLIAARDVTRNDRWPQLAAPFALLVGSVLFALTLGFTRSVFGAEFAASSRYLHVIAALLLPGVAVAADAIARHRPALGIVAIALLLIGIPGNIADVANNVGPATRYREQRRVITGLPTAAALTSPPRALHPAPQFAAEVTVGWLLDGARAGRIPVTRDLSPQERATDEFRLSLEQTAGGSTSCVPLRSRATRRVGRNHAVVVRGAVDVQPARRGTETQAQVLRFGTSLLSPVAIHTLRAVGGPLTLHISPRSRSAALC